MIVAVLQARFTSQRLPGKVLLPILGNAMLARQIERVRRAQKLDRLILATSTDSSDDPLASLADRLKVDCFRGDLNDVLDRFYHAAERVGPAHVVRLTGDCPLAEPAIVDAVVDLHVRCGFDYTSNCHPPTFPDGLDAEVMTFAALRSAWAEAKKPSERAHVTPFLYQNPQRFKIGNFVNEQDLSKLRWTVDEPADFDFVKSIYEELYSRNPRFNMSDVLGLLEKHPALAAINRTFDRNEGYDRDVKQEHGEQAQHHV